jgi:3-phosphoshikimate 1-carboxyvinyltransferase
VPREIRIAYHLGFHFAMQPTEIMPVSHPLNARVRVPGSKSLTNRALVIAALADGVTAITNALFSDDSLYLAGALQTLGFDVTLDLEDSCMRVEGLGGRIPVQKAEFFLGNAGTAMRFLTAFLTLGKGEFLLDGDARMRERPIGDLLQALSRLGANVSPLPVQGGYRREGPVCPPIKITASRLPGGKTEIAGSTSSQFLSALLMVAPYAQAPVDIELATELNSKPYVDMTLAVMAGFGVDIQREAYERFVINTARYSSPAVYPVESDASAASYFFAAPAMCGGTVQVEHISRRSLQGDIAFLDILVRMGCVIEESVHSILVTGPTELRGVDVDLRDIPDTAQTLAVLAPFATTPTRIRGIASARVKESDRISATCAELARLGVRVEEHEDGMTIYPCADIHTTTIQTYRDHRMAMAFSLVGLRVPGIAIQDPGCVSKTFPNFFEILDTLR